MFEALTVIQLCLQQTFICQPPDSPPMSYYQEGYSCYIDGTFYQSCPKPDYLTKPYVSVYDRSPYTKFK